MHSVSGRPIDSPLRPSLPQRFPTALLSRDKKIINRSLHYPISSQGTFLPLPAGGKTNKQTGTSYPVLIWIKPAMLPPICGSLGLEFRRQTQASAPRELLLHTGPKCQTTATHHKPWILPQQAPRERGFGARTKPGLGTSASEPGGGAGLRAALSG